MHEITHYHSLDETLKSGPPIDTICERCQSLKLVELFSGPRYDDFDQGHEQPTLDVDIGTLADIRQSSERCRICYIVTVFHDAKHLGEDDCTGGTGEDQEHCILKPYRTDALLHMKDGSELSNKETIATSLALWFKKPLKKNNDGIYKLSGSFKGVNGTNRLNWPWLELRRRSSLLQKDFFSWGSISSASKPPAVGKQVQDSSFEEEGFTEAFEGQKPFDSETGIYERKPGPVPLPRSAYCIHNCFLALTTGSAVARRSTLSLSESAQGPAVDWSSLRAWLRNCGNNHPGCRGDDQNWPEDNGMYIRCIDVQCAQLVPIDSQTRYLALSYVWGAAQSEVAAQVVRAVVPDNSTLVIENLPQTVRDAIQITKKLGERYLWVDCVCIDQTDQAAVQKNVQLMDRIYENALLTIIASTSDNAEEEVAGLRPNSRLRSSGDVVIDGQPMKAMCAKSVVGEFLGLWRNRGWTFQEWLLSKRCLFFSDNQILFRCQESSGLESFAPPEPVPSPGKTVSDPQFWADRRSSAPTLSRLPLGSPRWSLQMYAELVRDYTCRTLTYDSDILHAFTGIMRKIERSCGMSFVEGLPETDLLRALLWSFPTDWKGVKQHWRVAGRPSWTWAAYSCQSGYHCWEVDPSAGPGTASVQQYRAVVGSQLPWSRRAGLEAFASHHESRLPVFLSVSHGLMAEHHPDLYRAIQYRRAAVFLLPETKGFRSRSLMISSETRKIIVHHNPPVITQHTYVRGTKDDILHPVTNKLIGGLNFQTAELELFKFWLFGVNVGPKGEQSKVMYDAVLLYEWDLSIRDGSWHQKVVALIIDRLDDGTVERASLAGFYSEDWYSLPLVAERENLVMV